MSTWSVAFERTVYSAGNHQQEYAPLDAILGLPEGKFSFVVQDFAQMLGVDLAWAKDREVLERLLGIKLPVSSLEDMNRKMADSVSRRPAAERRTATSVSLRQARVGGDG